MVVSQLLLGLLALPLMVFSLVHQVVVVVCLVEDNVVVEVLLVFLVSVEEFCVV